MSDKVKKPTLPEFVNTYNNLVNRLRLTPRQKRKLTSLLKDNEIRQKQLQSSSEVGTSKDDDTGKSE